MTVITAARLRIEGTVQGVGFRPYAYRLAHELGLSGFVLNDSSGVLLEVEGPASEVEEFVARLPREAPSLAVIERLLREPAPPSGASGFRIEASSPAHAPANAPVTPDTAPCSDCLRELFDPGDRRHRYPFINCTNCGPRFTIVTSVPYDRPLTTMAAFEMCARCRAEYEDPRDRRFHAQPNACPECGPRLSLLAGTAAGAASLAGDPLTEAIDALATGAILAVKGIGGYHLACRADDEPAVARLRARKHREDKPFALMVPDLAAAESLVELNDVERALLASPERPIVLAPRRPATAGPAAAGAVARSVAPGAPELGVMLPYSPLHHLLVTRPLVMTSGNVSDEPIAYRDEDALARLGAIADLFLIHDRPIQTRTDDSIARVVEIAGRAKPTLIRRSRGYVPASLPLRLPLPETAGGRAPLLACGAELKSTFCLVKGARAWLSHHIGDLENFETLRSFREGVEHFTQLFDVRPEVVAHDLHPEYLSTKYARERGARRHIAVQHHHAHLAACLAEHGESGTAIGAIFDGTGYGPDGTIWGGEILHGDVRDFTRVGHLLAVRLPGGERAVRQPWRMACAWAAASGVQAPRPAAVDPARWDAVARLAATGLASPWTTSMGRLFDAVAALCGVRTAINYEGQAAIELEACADPFETRRYPMNVAHRDGQILIDPRETIDAIAADVRRGTGSPAVAARFHAAVATATVEACALAATAHATDRVVLSGGVFANRRLLSSTSDGLAAAGLRVLVPQRLPVNDGGIAYGQAAVAYATLEAPC